MRLTQCLTLLALLVFLCTCDSAESSYSGGARDFSVESTAMEPVPTELEMKEVNLDMDGSAESQTDEAMPRKAPKIIYTATARAQVEQLDTALAIVTRAVTKAGGYLASQHRRNAAYEHAVTLEVRLPAESLNSTLELLPLISKNIDYENLDSRDVSAEWLDLESRLQTKRDVRDRYVEILRNRAQKVEDILNAEDKIRVITEEIEAKEGRLRYLRDQVSLSTFTLELYETQEYRDTGESYSRSFGSKLLASLEFGWDMIQELLLGAVAIWPLLLIGGLAFWGFRRWRRKRKG